LDVLHPAVFFSALFFFYLLVGPLALIAFDGDAFELVSASALLHSALYLMVFLVAALVAAPIMIGYIPKAFRYVRWNDISPARIQLAAWLFFLIGVAIHLAYFARVGFIPALHPDAASVRVSAKQGSGALVIVATAFLYSAIIVWFSYWNQTGFISRVLTTAGLTIAVGVIAGVGFRGPAGYALLAAVFSIVFHGNKYSKYKRISVGLLLWGAILIVVMTVLDRVRYGEGFHFEQILHLAWTLLVNPANLTALIEHFDSHDFLYGSSFLSDLYAAIPGLNGSFLGVHLKEQLGMTFIGEGFTVTVVGEGYVNGGTWGVVLHAFLLGILLEAAYQALARRGSQTDAMFLILLTLSASRIPVAGVTPIIFFMFAPTAFCLVLLKWLARSRW
jgi:oligosaccharide repeat unit polymerase